MRFVYFFVRIPIFFLVLSFFHKNFDSAVANAAGWVPTLPAGITAAEVDAATDRDKYPDAAFPYAKKPNGCGSLGFDESAGRDLRDTWGRVIFTESCNNHDRCYYTNGTEWNVCNRNFYNSLRANCERDSKRRECLVPKIGGGCLQWAPWIPDPVMLSACYSVATLYYTGVQVGVALSIFRDAQKLQGEYNKWFRSYIASRQSQPGHPSQRTNFTVCNETNASNLHFAYAATEGTAGIREWTARGWKNIANRKCITIELPAGHEGTIHYYATDGTRSWPEDGSGPSYCTDFSANFSSQPNDLFSCDGQMKRNVNYLAFWTSSANARLIIR